MTSFDSQLEELYCLQRKVGVLETRDNELLAIVNGLTDSVDVIGENLATIQNDVAQIMQGMVVLHRPGMEAKFYTPEENTDEARMDALRLALEEATNTAPVQAVVELVVGRFAIAAGDPLTSFASAGNVKIAFSHGACVDYQDENDACFDPVMYYGSERRAADFGAYLNDDTHDSRRHLQAALFSMPEDPNTVEPVAEYPDIKTRNGRLILDNGGYLIGGTIWVTGYQEVIGNAGQYTILLPTEDFAPNSGPEKFMIRTANQFGSGQPQPNFSFSIRILNIQLANPHAANTKISGIEYGCGQGGEIRLVVNGMGQRSVVLKPTTSYVNIELWCLATPGGSPIHRGPLVHIVSCFALNFKALSLEHCNNYPPGGSRLQYTIGGHTTDLAALMAYNCFGLNFSSIGGESNSFCLYFLSCANVTMGPIVHHLAGQSGNGGTVLRMESCRGFRHGGITGRYFEYLSEISGSGYIEKVAQGNTVFSDIGPMDTESRSFAVSVGLLSIVRSDALTAAPEAVAYSFVNSGTPSNGALYLQGGTGYLHWQIKHGLSTGESGNQITTGYNIVLDEGGIYGVFVRSKLKVVGGVVALGGYSILSGAADPTTADIPAGYRQTWKNTTSGETRDWINDAGTMKKSAAYTV